jgi:hypothetical protein
VGWHGPGIDSVGRQHHRRTTDVRRGQRLGREDHVVAWPKPGKPAGMDEPTYAELPEQLAVRELRVPGRRRGCRPQVFVGVTTLCDAVCYSTQDLADLSRQRWHCERDLRSIKVA